MESKSVKIVNREETEELLNRARVKILTKDPNRAEKLTDGEIIKKALNAFIK